MGTQGGEQDKLRVARYTFKVTLVFENSEANTDGGGKFRGPLSVDMLRLSSFATGRRPLQRTFSSALSSQNAAASQKSVPLPSVVPQVNPTITEKVPQSPNKAELWSTNQNPRPAPASSPRFEQIEYSLQPAPLSAMEMIANEPIIMSDARIAVCDGGRSGATLLAILSSLKYICA